MIKDLFLCSNKSEEALLEKYKCKEHEIIFTTTNYQYYIQNVKNGRKVIFLESDELIPYESMWEIIDKVNDVIKSCGLKNDFMYLFSYHYEHYLPKTIATMILNLRLLDKLVHKHFIKNFYIIDNKDNWKINEAFFLYAISNNMSCKVIDDETGEIKDCLFTLKDSVYDTNILENRGYEELKLQEKKMIGSWLGRTRKLVNKNEPKLYHTGQLYCAENSAKHIGWVKQGLKVIGQDTIIISFYHSPDNKILEGSGYTVDCMEDYFDVQDFKGQYRTFEQDREAVFLAIAENLSVYYKNINLSGYIYKKIVNHFYREVSLSVYMNGCVRRYFLNNHFKTIGSWGTSNFWQTKICYENTRDSNTRFFRMEGTPPIIWKNYEPWKEIISIRFYSNEDLARQIIGDQFKGEVFYTFEILQGTDFYEKKLLSSKECEVNDLTIAYLPTFPFEGIETFLSYEKKCDVIFGKLAQCKCTLRVKNHPNIYQYLDDEVKKIYGNIPNIYLIDKSESVNVVIEDSDLVITDVSTVLFDAAFLQKPVFVVADFQEYELVRQHEEGFAIYRTPEDLCDELQRMVSEEEYCKKRMNEMIERQNRYFQRLFGEYNPNAQQEIRRIIK